MHNMVSDDLLEVPAATDRVHGHLGLELRAVGRRLLKSFGEGSAYVGKPLVGVMPRLRG